MRFLSAIIFVLIYAVHGTNSAKADAVISGPGCIIDGNTLQVGGKSKDKKCWGGITVRLHGSIAPQLAEVCTNSKGAKWECGKKAKKALANMIEHHGVTCYHLDGEFKNNTPIATCVSGRTDLALELVTLGMAKAQHDQSKRYELEEKDAIKSKRGIWK